MVLKELILTVCMLVGCDGLEGTGFFAVSMLGGVVVLKELIFHSCYIERV